MVASEVDGFVGGTLSSSDSGSTSTHIYCKPVKIKDAVKSRNIESDESNCQNKDANPEEKVPSNVVPIDVSGQTFSRMASFRRSLIHVDFLIRRKKKRDKRRNTVAEGSVKDLKDALEKSLGGQNQFTATNGINSYQHINAASKKEYNYENKPNDKSPIEQNNNAEYIKSVKNNKHMNSIDNQITHADKNALNTERLKKEPKLTDSEFASKQFSSNKRKPKSHIPISTVSAAMNVAVEMRQHNGVKKGTSGLNTVCNGTGHKFDSDNKLPQDKRSSNSSNNEESSQDESWTDYKKRFQDKYRSLADRKDHNRSNLTDTETEVSSSASSENINPQDTGATTSAESDTFFISSDESDQEPSEVIYFQENCGSSTSVGTASDGSLNSLLSETGTEMTSSTGTLTSVGREYLLTPPPPPPPMMISATANDKDLIEKFSDSPCFEHNIEAVKNKKNSRTDIPRKQSKQLKLPKPPKSESVVSQKNSSDNAKNIFTSLVSLKTHTKHKIKKDTEKKKFDKSPHQPAFDMYGNNSPVKTKQIPAFIKENYSPVIQKQEKSHMRSFLVSDKSKTFTEISDNESIDKNKTDFNLYRNSASNSPDISEVAKTRETQTMNNIPSKYEHHVTVTPVQRGSNIEQKNIHPKRLFEPEKKNSQHGNLSKQGNTNIENQALVSQIHRPNTPVTLQLQEKSKLAARVVLDFNGKVIYTTNSLDRNNHHPCQTINMHDSAQNKTCDPYFKHRKSNYDSCQENDLQQILQTNPLSSFRSSTPNPHRNASFNEMRYNDNYRNSEYNSRNQAYEHEYLSPIMKGPHGYKPENPKMFVPKKADIRPFSYAGPNTLDLYFDDPSNSLLPNPNISGLPIQESMLTRRNVNLHSKQMEKINMSSSECSSHRLSDVFCTTPTSQTSCGSTLNKSPQSTMSTEDLFAVIHDCKKRMNIKTDSDISLASSSRSCSPSYLRPSSSKGTLAETGFLSPRSQIHLETSGDRRSWADFRPVDSVYYERKSLASDRLGPTKPTSMHDFKMLLLQARTSSQNSGQRKSAVEMLKLPLNQNNRNTMSSLPLNLSPRNSVSISSQNSPTYELNVSNGHSTVPFKRGNRVRNSLQSRYIMYPPIFEDCSEDSEHCSDMISNKAMNVSSIETVSEKEHADSKHNVINNNGCMQNHREYSCDNATNAQVK